MVFVELRWSMAAARWNAPAASSAARQSRWSSVMSTLAGWRSRVPRMGQWMDMGAGEVKAEG
jgi:hypothetical protein